MKRTGLQAYQKVVDRNKINGSKGGRPKNPKEPKKPSGLNGLNKEPKKADSVSGSDSDKGSDKDSDNKLTADRFNEFWNLYDKKRDKPKCESKFKKLTVAEIDLLFAKLPLYIQSTPDKTYRKDPIRWLNGKCWNDEIQTNTNKSMHDFSNQNYQSGEF